MDNIALGQGAAPREDLTPVFAAAASYFGLLSEPTRLRILHTICRSEQSVGSIVRSIGATQCNVSRHLALLYRSGVVSRRKEHNKVFYSVSDPVFADVCGTVCAEITRRSDERTPSPTKRHEAAQR